MCDSFIQWHINLHGIFKETYIYIYICLKLPCPENPANTYMQHTDHRTPVSTLLDLISSSYRDLHHWRSNQQRQYAETENLPLGHRFTPHISYAELTSHKFYLGRRSPGGGRVPYREYVPIKKKETLGQVVAQFTMTC